jgi:hypothetical protein
MTITMSILFAAVSYFAWLLIHEFSHLLMAKKLIGVNKWKMKLYPHRAEDSSLRFGAVWYWMNRQPSSKEHAAILLAPRIPNVLASILFIFGAVLSGYLATIWFIFWGAGIIDLVYGSIGISKLSDLKRASEAVNKNHWHLRLAGLGIALTSIVAHFLLL